MAGINIDLLPAAVAAGAGAVDGWVIEDHNHLLPWYRGGVAIAGVVASYLDVDPDIAETLLVCGIYGLATTFTSKFLAGNPPKAAHGRLRAAPRLAMARSRAPAVGYPTVEIPSIVG